MTTHDNIPTVLDNSIVEISLCELVQCDGTLTYITKIESDTCTSYTCTSRYTQRASPPSSRGTAWSTRVLPVRGYRWSTCPMTRPMEHRWGRCGWASSAWARWRAEPNAVKAQGPTPLLWSVLCTCRWGVLSWWSTHAGCTSITIPLWWQYFCGWRLCLFSSAGTLPSGPLSFWWEWWRVLLPPPSSLLRITMISSCSLMLCSSSFFAWRCSWVLASGLLCWRCLGWGTLILGCGLLLLFHSCCRIVFTI